MTRPSRILPLLLFLLIPAASSAQTVPPCGTQYTWSGITPLLSSARYGHSAVWTGFEMIVWGGKDADTLLSDGMRFDPLRGTWVPMAPGPLQARTYHTAVWTGEEMIVWGGLGQSEHFKDGARYNPRNDTWAPMTSLPSPLEGRWAHAAVWTGEHLVVWGGVRPYSPALLNMDTGGIYDPETDSWQLMSTVNAPSARYHHSMVWTGSEIIVWGGWGGDDPAGPFSRLNTGGRYDPLTDTWTPTSLLQAPAPRTYHAGAWTGSKMLIWGGRDAGNTGGLYDPVTNSWADMSIDGAPPGGTLEDTLWNGEMLLAWPTYQHAFRYDPAAEVWSQDPAATGAPSFRSGASTVLADGSVIVWGGSVNPPWQPPLGDGGRYFPEASPDDDQDGFTLSCGDCNDQVAAISPGALQACDGLNNDCGHPRIPSLIETNEYDDDGDGVSECAGDCDDVRAAVAPGAPQICDGRNNDCLDPVYPALNGIELDQDGDLQSSCSGDCDEGHSSVYNGAPQTCDGLNNDCSHPAWPALGGTESDLDLDAFRFCDGDCDEGNPGVYPGATEVCDGVNNNCLDPDWPSTLGTNDGDEDGDGFSICLGDCSPLLASIHPGAPEICDGLNNDCADPAWPSLGPSEQDGDLDGFRACQECDDTNAATHHGAVQICDGLNNDCNSPFWPALTGTNDGDDDGDGFSECALDCNDDDSSLWQPAGEATDLRFAASMTQLLWSPPLQPGADAPQYDVLRWWLRGEPAQCLVSDAAGTSAVDEEPPYVGGVFYYLVRAQNPCGVGPAGFTSSGDPIEAPACP